MEQIGKDTNKLDDQIATVRAHNDVLKELAVETQSLVPRNEAYMQAEQKKVRQSWQDLANELRNQIKTKQLAGEEAIDLETDVVKATFKAVSSLFLYQKAEFEKLSTKLHEAEKELVKNINDHVAKLKKKAKQLKSHLLK